MTNYNTGFNAGLNNEEKTGLTEDYQEGYEQGQTVRDERENHNLW